VVEAADGISPELAAIGLLAAGIGPGPQARRPLVQNPTRKGNPVMFKNLSTSLIVRGVLAVIVGILAIAWPGITVLALVILFAIYAFMDAGLQAARAFSSRSAGPVFGHLLLGLVDIAAGVVAIVWPGPTALVLVIVVAAWAFVSGFFELFAAFQSGETAGTRAMFILAGLVSIAFGVVLAARPGIGAVTIALLFGLYSLIFGISEIVLGIDMHRGGKAAGHLRSVLSDAA
jgi:uncharacterized membrane protein HdeD (DUF308 family)